MRNEVRLPVVRSFRDVLYDRKIRSWFFQIATVSAIVAFFLWLRENTLSNLAAQGKDIAFDFFSTTSSFGVLSTPGTWLFDYLPGRSTILDLFWVGVVNTLVIAVLGVFLATFLGFAIGIMRLSKNVIISGFATIYIEVLRNIPLLLQLFFWYFVVLRALHDKRQKTDLLGEWVGVNITGLYMPFPVPGGGFSLVVLALLAGLAGLFAFRRYAHRRQEATGKQLPVVWIGLAILLLPPLALFFLLGQPLAFEVPQFRTDGPLLRRGYMEGIGMVAKPEMIAMLFALVLYTASFIAEIVRAGVLAVARGQWEAAGALGLRNGPTLRLVIVPQAMRVIIPPLASQYLNLTKNSSLAVAIAYPDVVSLFGGTALAQLGREIPMIFVMMTVYLLFSLSTSLLMNWYNARKQLVER